MSNLPSTYFNIQSRLFPMVEEEIGELTEKSQEFLRIIELVKPSRFIIGILSWNGSGRPPKSRENLLRAFFLKSVYNFPTTKVLVENLKGNPTWRQLCGNTRHKYLHERLFLEHSKISLSSIYLKRYMG